jgi:short-subunit dehydrogenase
MSATDRTTLTWTAAAALTLGAGAIALAAYRAKRPRFSFADKAVLITGGSRGLGLVMARQLAREGARLALVARNGDALDRAVDELSRWTQVIGLPCDVADRDRVEAAVAQTLTRFGGIDVLINNAGVIQVGPFEHMTVDDYRQAIDVHLFGPLHTTLAVLPQMRRRGEGRIVNIASIGGKAPVPHLLPYTASKFALVGFSEGLAAEVRKDGVIVTTVCPGLMRTGSPPNARFKGRRHAEYAWFAISDAAPGLSMSAERAAEQVIEACRAGRSRVVLSLPAKLGVALHELCPQTYARLSALAASLLPGPTDGRSPQAYPGWESTSALAPSLLTTLSDRATLRNNEVE